MMSPLPSGMLRLGFGCARLRGGRWGTASRQLLEAAYDSGIRYFDTARMYGEGEAEGILGRFLGARRRAVFVASKAGILPPSGIMANRWPRRAAKLVGLALPALAPRPAGPRFGMFDPATMRKSVDTSLRMLRTDHLDALLLHEVDAADLANGVVMPTLNGLAAAGKIGLVGVASTPAQTRRIVPSRAGCFRAVQVASTVLEDGLAPLGDRRGFLTITHSVLAGCLERIVVRLTADRAFRDRWIDQIAVDPASRDAVAELLLAEALDANRDGVVLFSSASPARIARAARIARERPFAAGQIANLRTLLAC